MDDRNFDEQTALDWIALIERASKELGRVLKANGHFLIITANPDAYPAWTDLYPDRQLRGKRLEGTMVLPGALPSRDVLHLHSFDEIRDSLHHAGLKIEGV